MLPDGRLVRTASTTQDLALIVTLFRRKDGSFEKKEAAFTLVEEGRDGSVRTGERVRAGAGVRLASHARSLCPSRQKRRKATSTVHTPHGMRMHVRMRML